MTRGHEVQAAASDLEGRTLGTPQPASRQPVDAPPELASHASRDRELTASHPPTLLLDRPDSWGHRRVCSLLPIMVLKKCSNQPLCPQSLDSSDEGHLPALLFWKPRQPRPQMARCLLGAPASGSVLHQGVGRGVGVSPSVVRTVCCCRDLE